MTTSGKHTKHPKLSRPESGIYHRNEIAIYGTKCLEIERFAKLILENLSPFNGCYIDADHQISTNDSFIRSAKKKFLFPNGFQEWNTFDDKMMTKAVDFVLINGNHYSASRQIIIIDPSKKDSLQRRIDQLDHIVAVITTKKGQEIYDFLKSKISPNTLFFAKDQMDDIIEMLKNTITTPPLTALILGGGKSTRMGEDKSLIQYHGKPQAQHIAEICHSLGLETFISMSHHFDKDTLWGFPVIKDRFLDMGPFGAIVSAMMHDPNSAKLVMATDLPFISNADISLLISQRDPSRIATAFIGEDKPFPEPLLSIYEPKAYDRMLRFLAMGFSCPRKVLINSDVKKISIPTKSLTNANTPQERDDIMNSLQSK